MLASLTSSPKRTRVAALDTIFFDNGQSSITFKSPSDPYLVINRLPPAAVGELDNNTSPPPPNCALDPPLHWHTDQVERFHVLEGEAVFYLDGRVHTVAINDVVTVPRQAYHTFRNSSTEHDLLIEFVLGPKNRDRDEAFFRNTQTYRDDCRKAGVARNMFQVLMFNRLGNVVLAFPGPKFIARPLGLIYNFVGAMIGRWVLGYSYSYLEYYDPKAK